MSQIKQEAMVKASKLSLFRGGLPKADRLLQAPEMPSEKSLLADALGDMELARPPPKLQKQETATTGISDPMDYHDIIVEELRI